MKINKKAVAGLLGGGVTLTVATIGGLKLNDTLKYNNKLRHFGKNRTRLKKQLPSMGYRGWTMPKWDDLEIWKRHFNNGNKSIFTHENGSDSTKTYLTPEELRDACYDMVTNKDKDFKSCTPSRGWCNSCLVEKTWFDGKYANDQ